MKIYTQTGDDGTTALIGGERVQKCSARINAYGTVDELNSNIGLLITQVKDKEIVKFLNFVQNSLFDIGCVLADPKNRCQKTLESKFDTKVIEQEIDRMDSDLEPLSNFILPGGAFESSLAHVARTICRRGERIIVGIEEKSENDLIAIKLLNRLSDYFFILARYLNKKSDIKDIIWKGI